MLKRTLLLVFIVLGCLAANAQSADSVYSKYLDFNLARFQGENDKLVELGESLLPVADKLPEKARINFYFSIGKVYEDNNTPEKALIYYNKVVAAVPDYYVVHRGLGYIYLEQAKEIRNKLYASSDPAVTKKLTDDYNTAARKALPHLEKAQACDPSDETLDEIKSLYKNMKDTEGLNTLDSRLKELSKHCIDILEDK
jgi:tetratricopeptide (TPR) repeat protein